MKRKYLAVGLLALALKGKTQIADSAFQKRNISTTDIEVLYSMYGQEGEHSAVTGGIGTEKLNVYAPSFQISFNNETRNISLEAGSDIISSASVDKIDDVVSSASRIDMRSHAQVGMINSFQKGNLEIGASAGFSLESDYLAFPMQINASLSKPDQDRKYSIKFAASFDDLRWGRLNPDYRRPVKLVYPKELRNTDWFDNYRRNTFQIAFGLEQAVGKRLKVAFYPEIVFQQGLLSTPFHRIYFSDYSEGIEQLPNKRTRIPVGFRANYYASKKSIIKSGFNYYSDNFDIKGIAAELEWAWKFSERTTFHFFGEAYNQSKSKYFKPYQSHSPEQKYFTSDYDLSAFSSFKVGLGYRWSPFSMISRKSYIRDVNIRYAFFKRSDSLYAHMVSASIRFTRMNKLNK